MEVEEVGESTHWRTRAIATTDRNGKLGFFKSRSHSIAPVTDCIICVEGMNFAEISNRDLKGDVRRLEGVVENVERSSKTDQRLTDAGMKEIKRDVDSTLKDINRELVKNQKETQSEIRSLRTEVDSKIKKALDNPLSN